MIPARWLLEITSSMATVSASRFALLLLMRKRVVQRPSVTTFLTPKRVGVVTFGESGKAISIVLGFLLKNNNYLDETIRKA